jgi:hypothetical protein
MAGSLPGVPDSGDSGKVKVELGYPVDSFEHGIRGLEPSVLVRGEPAEVTKSQLEKLREVAEANRVPLEEVDS